MNEIDAVHTKSIAQKAVLLDQENVQLKAKIAELERENRTLVRDCAIAVEDGYNKRDQIAHIESDLQAARTAAELAATHREASGKVIREFLYLLDDETQFNFNEFMSRSDEAVTQAKELLSQDSLTPSKTEQLTSLVKAYEYFVVQYFTTKDSKAEEARDMLIEQYNRVLGEVPHAS